MRTSARNHMALFASLLACSGLDVGAQKVTVTAPTRPRLIVKQARVLLDAGDARAAEQQYDSAIVATRDIPESAERTRLLASALFGRATARQQQLAEVVAVDAARDSLQRQVIADYGEAERLDSGRFAGAARNNIGITLRDAGRHRDALAAFVQAARSTHPARATFFLHAASEYEALGAPDSAVAAFRSALRIDSTLAPARFGLMRVLMEKFPVDSMIALATKWTTNPAHGPIVTEALYSALASGRRGASMPDTALSLLVINFATMGLGPTDVLRDHAERLRFAAGCRAPRSSTPNAGAAARAAPGLCAAAVEVIDAAEFATRRDPRPINRRMNSSGWWTARFERMAVWSALMRSFAAYFEGSGNRALAIAHYEAALARPWDGGPPPWMDVESIAPMAMLYGQDRAVLSEFLDGVFQGKGLAYARDDVPLLRRMHTALGAFFAASAVWGEGPRGAEFQLERMRLMTGRMNQGRADRERLIDPPDLLNQLRLRYCRIRRTDAAAALLPELADAYRRTGRSESVPVSPCAGTKPQQPT